jgi:hypothetical protein
LSPGRNEPEGCEQRCSCRPYVRSHLRRINALHTAWILLVDAHLFAFRSVSMRTLRKSLQRCCSWRVGVLPRGNVVVMQVAVQLADFGEGRSFTERLLEIRAAASEGPVRFG